MEIMLFYIQNKSIVYEIERYYNNHQPFDRQGDLHEDRVIITIPQGNLVLFWVVELRIVGVPSPEGLGNTLRKSPKIVDMELQETQE